MHTYTEDIFYVYSVRTVDKTHDKTTIFIFILNAHKPASQWRTVG